MNSTPIDYLAAATLLRAIGTDHGPLDSPEAIIRFIEVNKYLIDKATAETVGARLIELGFLAEVKDEYAGHFYRAASAGAIKNGIAGIRPGTDASELRYAFEQGWPLLRRAMDNEQFWIDLSSAVDAAHGTTRDDTAHENGSVDVESLAPASDRIVTRADNRAEFSQIEDDLEVIDGLIETKDNELADRLGNEREVLRQEVGFAKEAVKSGLFRVSSLIGWLHNALKFIIQKFSGTAVAETAKRLFQLLENML